MAWISCAGFTARDKARSRNATMPKSCRDKLHELRLTSALILRSLRSKRLEGRCGYGLAAILRDAARKSAAPQDEVDIYAGSSSTIDVAIKSTDLFSHDGRGIAHRLQLA